MRILIAEDEKDLNRILTARLKAEHYSVDSCKNGQEVLEYMAGAEYDALILDIMMPGMDGYHTCSVQKQRTAIKHLDFPAAGTIILRSHFPTVN